MVVQQDRVAEWYMMQCKRCLEKLEVFRTCGKVRMRCSGCRHEYQIHEIADELDQETEEILARYTTIIYD
jgi:uncharacterized protein (DUF983 family)